MRQEALERQRQAALLQLVHAKPCCRRTLAAMHASFYSEAPRRGNLVLRMLV